MTLCTSKNAPLAMKKNAPPPTKLNTKPPMNRNARPIMSNNVKLLNQLIMAMGSQSVSKYHKRVAHKFQSRPQSRVAKVFQRKPANRSKSKFRTQNALKSPRSPASRFPSNIVRTCQSKERLNLSQAKLKRKFVDME